MTRAENRWYRTLPQMRTDIDLISMNAECVYQEGHVTREKAKEITTSLHAALDSGESDDGNESAEDLEDEYTGVGASGVGSSRAVLADASEGPSTRLSRARRATSVWEDEPESPTRQTRSQAGRMPDSSPEPESPSAHNRRSRGARKRRMNGPGGWGPYLLSEEPSQERVERPRRTRQRVTYAS